MYVATEIGYDKYKSDVICIPKNNKDGKLIEIEVKVSKSDLLSEFVNKSSKHDDLLLNSKDAPNYFYFAVPEELVDFTKTLLKEKGKKNYGIIQYKEKWRHKNVKQERLDLEDCISIVNPAKRLRKESLTEEVFDRYKHNMFLRIMYEQIAFYKEQNWNTNRYKPILREKEKPID